jgi:uncharacterized protein YyaL (SSP411 family)
MKINHLSEEKSPYLLRSAESLVDWHPWGTEAFKKAEAEGKPIFLNVGFFACHWCHRMEREAFENPEIANLLNQEFVSIKVDREERPDIEKVYLAAVQMITGTAGWPVSVFLTSDGRPFYGGTYFPPEPAQGYASFRQTLETVIETFREKHDRLNMSADIITGQVRGACYPSPAPGHLNRGVVEKGVVALLDRFDDRNGGLRGTPKFPPATAVALLFRALHRTGDPDVHLPIQKTLDGMIRGGLYDQIGGGFHRYSTDARWLIPSFEKTLADNALLIPVYIDAFLITGVQAYARAATETMKYVRRELRSPEGGFYSSQDSEIDGKEGQYYLWSEDALVEALGDKDGALLADLFNVRATGQFDAGLSVLHRASGMGGLARQAKMSKDEFLAKFQGWRETLLTKRQSEMHLPVDDKIVTAWNGLMITALARVKQVTQDPDCLTSAHETANFVLKHLRDSDGALRRYYREGPSDQPGFLDDYAYLSAGLLDLYETDFDPRWLDECRTLTDRMVERFWDDTNGGFYFSADSDLLARPKEFEDGATPSANAVAAFTLLRLGVLLNSKAYLEKGFRTIEGAYGLMERVPAALPGLLSALDFYLSPTKEIAVAGSRDASGTEDLLAKVWGRYLPNRVLGLIDPGKATPDIPLLKDKQPVDGEPAVYLCENYECDAPITDPEELARALYIAPEGE